MHTYDVISYRCRVETVSLLIVIGLVSISDTNHTNNPVCLCLHFSICACHPCAGAMPIFPVPFQLKRMNPEGTPGRNYHLKRRLMEIEKGAQQKFKGQAPKTPHQHLFSESTHRICGLLRISNG